MAPFAGCGAHKTPKTHRRALSARQSHHVGLNAHICTSKCAAIATHYDTLEHTAIILRTTFFPSPFTLQHTAGHCNTLQSNGTHACLPSPPVTSPVLQHTASRCNIPQHTATHCNTRLRASRCYNTPTSIHCNTLTSIHCNSL